MSSFAYLAPVYALCSAFLFALSNHLINLGLEGSDARTGTLVSIAASAAVYWLLAPFFVESWYWLTWAFLLFALVGIIRPSLSSVLATSSIKVMGPTLTSALTAATPLFGALFAITFLGEQLTVPIAIGTLAVIAGAVVGAWSPQGMKRSWPLWAMALPLGASLIRATGHVVTKHGLVELPSPSFAVMVSNSVSLAVAIVAFKLQSRPFVGTRASHLWFIGSGVANALSLQFLNNALAVGELVAVIPIVSATPVFTMIMGYLWFGREIITARTLWTIALIVPGVLLVALSGR
ncbi:MAG: DMT family transporter [Hyphomicrobiaceae bacterium]|nr:DMT family transporter [Hyphomicrobiaceae bacterium]